MRGCTNGCLKEIRPVEVLLLQKWRKTRCFFFASCSTPGKGLYRSSWHLKPISLDNDLHQVLKPKKLALERSQVSHNAASNITHSAIADQDSSRVTTTFDVYCSTLCSGRFQRKFCESRRKVGTISYRAVCKISRGEVQGPGTVTGAGAQITGCIALVGNIPSCDYKK